MNAIMYHLYTWQMMLKTPQLTLFILRTIIPNEKDDLEVSYNKPHFTAAKPFCMTFNIKSDQ